MPILRGKRGSGRLRAALEEPFGLQPRLELLEGELQRAEPLRLQQLDDQLVLAPLRRRPRRLPKAMTCRPSVGLEANPAPAAAEEHGAQLRVVVLQREVRVARAVELEVRDLALDPHRREALLEHLAQARGQLRDRQHRAVGAHRVPPTWRSAARSVLRRSIAMVIGPDAARHRRDRAHALATAREIDVADHLAGLAGD